jgi:hypothetical protein
MPSGAPPAHEVSLQPADSLASLSELTRGFPLANGDFYFRASSGLIARTAAGITTVATEQFPPTGLSPARAATSIAARIFPTLSLRIFPRMLGPLPRRSHGVHIPVSSSVSSAFPQRGLGRLPASLREYDFSRGVSSRPQTFLYVQASEFARLPGRSYRCSKCRRAAETFTSGQNVLRCLCSHRIC